MIKLKYKQDNKTINGQGQGNRKQNTKRKFTDSKSQNADQGKNPKKYNHRNNENEEKITLNTKENEF